MANTIPASYIPDKVLSFTDQFVYCREEYKWVLTMALAVSHARDRFTTVPYILATGDKPHSGKSTIAFDLPALLAFNLHTIDRTTTKDALNNMYLERVTPNTGWDDIGKIFGLNGTNGLLSGFYTMLIKSYRKTATTKMSRNGSTMEVPTYGMAFLNGLKNAVPYDLFTRCIWFQMEEAPDGYPLRDVLESSAEAEAKILKEALHAWAGQHGDEFEAFMRGKVRRIHPKLEKRKRQLWGPLFAAADAAGGEWPRRIYQAFVAIALDASERPPLIAEQRVLLDAADIIMKRKVSAIFISDLIAALRELPDGAFYRDSETEHLTERLFPEAFGPDTRVSAVKLYGSAAGQQGRARGYRAAPVLEAAADLRDMLYPAFENEITDPLEDKLAFEPARPSRLIAEGTAA